MTATKTAIPASAASMNGNHTAKVTWEEIPVGDLFRVESAQRELIAAWVRQLAREMDLDALGSFKVSRRPNGKDVILDGGHRREALLELDMGEWPVQVQVYHGLTPAEEAGLFRRFNKHRKVSAIEDFLKGVKEGDQECVTINRICNKVGLKVDRTATDGNIKCVAAMRRVYNGRGSRIHPDELREALMTATEAWGHTAAAVEGQIVHGLGDFFKQYDADRLDRDELVKKLTKFPGGPPRLLAHAHARAEVMSRPIYRGVVEVVVGLYNKQRRKNLLVVP